MATVKFTVRTLLVNIRVIRLCTLGGYLGKSPLAWSEIPQRITIPEPLLSPVYWAEHSHFQLPRQELLPENIWVRIAR